MHRERDLWPLFVAALSIVALGALAAMFVAGLSPEVGAPIVAAVISILSLFYNRRSERKQLIEQELRKQKAPTYEDFAETYQRMFMQGRPGIEPLKERELNQFALRLTPKLMAWGSDKMVRKFADFRAFIAGLDLATNKSPTVLYDILLDYEDLLFAIRTDLGHDNKSLEVGDLLALFINDLDRSALNEAVKRRDLRLRRKGLKRVA